MKNIETINLYTILYILPILSSQDFDYNIDSLLIPLSISLDTLFQAFDVDTDGSLLGHKFISVVLERFSEATTSGKIPFELNDLESIILVLIQIIEKCSPIPPEIIGPLIEISTNAILSFEQMNSADLVSFFLLLSSICTKYEYVPSEELVNRFIECCDAGFFYTNFMRCITAVGLISISQTTDYRKEEMISRANALITNTIPNIDLNSDDFNEFINGSKIYTDEPVSSKKS